MKNKATLKKVLHLIKPYRLLIAASILCSLVSVCAQLIIPYFSGNAIDFMLEAGKVSFEDILRIIGIIALITAVAAFSQHLCAMCNNKVTYRVCRDLRNLVSDKLHTLPVSYLDSHPSGDLISRMISDVDTFADGLLMGFTQLFSGVITIAATIILMLWLNGFVALTVLLLTPLSIFVAKFITSKTHRFFTEQAKIRGEQTALINELVEGQNIVSAFGYEDETLQSFDEINNRLERTSMLATFFSSLTNPSTRLVNNIVYAAVALISSLFALMGTGITIGQVSIFLSYASQYAKPFNEISGVITELQNALTCAKRVFDLLEEADRRPDPENPVYPEVEGSVELKAVDFSYSPDKKLITDLSLKVEPGKRVAIVGPTGCGKTTLINLLMNFYDVDDGEILVDGENIQNMTRHTLRSRYAMVLQDTWLSGGTVKENIAYGKPDATDEEIISAAKSAHAHSFIRRLPKGYDTKVSDNLSVGQRQLLCIARAMLCLPPMLILDEATSSIDTRTEMKIQDAFAKMMKGRTSFIVAHRLSTIKEADTILVMNNGAVIEQGNHEELMSKNGFYAKLYNSQFEE